MKEMTEDDRKCSEIAQTIYLYCLDQIEEKFQGSSPSRSSKIMFTILSGCIFNLVLNICQDFSDEDLDNTVQTVKKAFSRDFDAFIKRYKKLQEK